MSIVLLVLGGHRRSTNDSAATIQGSRPCFVFSVDHGDQSEFEGREFVQCLK